MNYQETLDYLYSQLPMFHRIGKAAYKDNLNNAEYLDRLCGNPHRYYKTIHIAGTNGKGSVSHMLASVLQSCGYKTGLFTSPHLKDFRERIRINGEMITPDAVIRFVSKYKTEFEHIKPSFFEMTSALAFDYFKQEQVDVAVIEVGMGGRLDSTNIITPTLSVITNIGFDHMEFLGNTLAKIAYEKAGIIKEKIPIVIGESHPETKPVFQEMAILKNSPLTFADEQYQIIFQRIDEEGLQSIEIEQIKTGQVLKISLDLLGLYQQKNICSVLCAIETLRKTGFQIQDSALMSGIKHVCFNTGLMGRWQIMHKKPLMICDTGHNAEGIFWVVKQINKLTYGRLHFVMGVVNDKDIARILELLPKQAVYYFTKANIPRALGEDQLLELALRAGLIGSSYPSVRIAMEEAKNNAAPNDLIFIGGSTFIVAEALQELEKK
jgi:dihydrofolate synthase / folylpolyglutamate synthase